MLDQLDNGARNKVFKDRDNTVPNTASSFMCSLVSSVTTISARAAAVLITVIAFLSVNSFLLLRPVDRQEESIMAPVKLTYFDVTALGEPIRLLLAYGKLEFEDERLNDETFPPRKAGFPYGKVPVLEIEGKTIHQSAAIGRYLAKKFGLTGKTEWDSLECDIMVDTMNDFRAALASFTYEEHEEAKAQKKELVMSTQVPYYLGKFEDHVAKNGGHFVNNQLTWADFVFAGMSGYFNHMAEKDLFADRPALKALREKVLALPQLKPYLDSKPPAEY